MRTHTGTVVVVGSINVDQVITVQRHPLPGETLMGTSLSFLPGGKGANQAVAAALLGAPVSMIGHIGNDRHSVLATDLLRDAGVDLSAVKTVDGPTGLALVSVSDDGENTIVVIPGANTTLGAAEVAQAAALITAAAVVVLQGEIPAAGIEAAARLATGRVVLNLAPVLELDAEVLHLADPLVVNEHEAALLLSLLNDVPAASSGAGADTGDDFELVARLRAFGIRSVVLTRGAQGAICSDAHGTTSVPAPTVSAVDTAGAGDAFVGALSSRLAAGESLQNAVQLAVRVGAFAVQGRGTQPSYPTVTDLLPEVRA
jgi:ribokinase